MYCFISFSLILPALYVNVVIRSLFFISLLVPTIFFSQAAKLLTIAQGTGFGQFDLSILLYVIPAAIVGGFVGALISGKISSERVTQVYQIVILLVLLLNIWNGLQLFI